MAEQHRLYISTDALRRCVTVGSLVGARDADEAHAVTEAIPLVGDRIADERRAIVRWLAKLYPPVTGGEWQPLRPERLAEYLIGQASDPGGWLTSAVVEQLATKASATQRAHMTYALDRAKERKAAKTRDAGAKAYRRMIKDMPLDRGLLIYTSGIYRDNPGDPNVKRKDVKGKDSK
jgi:hypothetical protein